MFWNLEEVEEDQYKPPTHSDLNKLDIWVHEWCNILKEGKCLHTQPEENEEMDEDKKELIMK